MRILSTVALLLLSSAGQAHYHMLIPDKPSAKKGEPVTVTFQFGHPYESELSDMLAPREVVLVGPDGKVADVTKKLEKVSLKGAKGKVDGYRLKFTPGQRGDYALVMTSAPTPLPGDKESVEDTVKVVVHVQAQKGWDRTTSHRFVWTPLTRPYGLLPGAVFQASIGDRDDERGPSSPGNNMVEVERYNPTPPKALPADEFITRTMKVDRNGVVTTNLPEAGWWCLTTSHAIRASVNKVVVKRRATLWVYVDKSAPTKPAE